VSLDFEQIQKPGRKLRKLLRKMSARPSPEQVHDFRTNSRQLESTLQAFGLDSSRNGRRVLKPLARLRKRAGKIRDMDVLIGYASNLRRPDGEQECAIELLEHLGAERRRHAKKFHSAARRKGADLRRDIKRSRKQLLKRGSRAQVPGGNHSLPASALQISSELTATARLNHTNLHPFRLKVKALRNILKLSDSPDEKLLDSLGQVKDAIGEWHDYQELISIAEKVLDHGSQCRLIHELKHMSRNKYCAALAQAERLRKQQLGFTRATGGRSTRPDPSKPVWTAAMRLAA
jgi:CHAD domain-containing protein